MGRMTITLNNILEKSLRQIQGTFIHDFEKDWSFTTIVNMVILGGLIGAKKFKDEDWKIIHNFLEEEKLSLDLEAGIDSLASHVLDMKGWGQVVQQMQLKEAEKKAGEKK